MLFNDLYEVDRFSIQAYRPFILANTETERRQGQKSKNLAVYRPSRLMFFKKIRPMQQRKLISFEGGEGSGKSTQIPLLESYLRSRGETVLSLREPGSTYIGERIRQLLQHDPEASAMFPETELLLFEASRAQLVRERIRPALEKGHWVLCDRFFDSSTAYQGAARRLSLEHVHWLNRFAVTDCTPGLSFFFSLSAEMGQRRRQSKGGRAPDRIERESIDFFQKIEEAYRRIAEENPQRFITLDAGQNPDEIATKIREQVDGHFFSR